MGEGARVVGRDAPLGLGARVADSPWFRVFTTFFVKRSEQRHPLVRKRRHSFLLCFDRGAERVPPNRITATRLGAGCGVRRRRAFHSRCAETPRSAVSFAGLSSWVPGCFFFSTEEM